MAITGTKGEIRAGRAAIELGVRDRTGRALRSISKRFGMTFGKSVTRAIRNVTLSLTAMAAAIGLVGNQLINMASDMQEEMNKFDVMFGNSANEVREWGFALGAAVGRSRMSMVKALGSFKALATSMGMTDEQGVLLSKSMQALAIDLGSFYNMADSEAAERLHSALVGNHETLRKFGIAITEATIKQEAMNEGLNPNALTDVQKALIRYNLILAATSKQQGDAARTAHTFANQKRILYAQISDAAVALGEHLLPYAEKFIRWLNDAVRWTIAFTKAAYEMGKGWELAMDLLRASAVKAGIIILKALDATLMPFFELLDLFPALKNMIGEAEASSMAKWSETFAEVNERAMELIDNAKTIEHEFQKASIPTGQIAEDIRKMARHKISTPSTMFLTGLQTASRQQEITQGMDMNKRITEFLSSIADSSERTADALEGVGAV